MITRNILLRTARSQWLINRSSFRLFSSSPTNRAEESPEAARAKRLQEFLVQIRSNEKICNQLRTVQITIAGKMELTNGEPPSLMQQLQLLRDQEVCAEMLKLSEIMKEEKINLKAEDVSFLMQALKAQMDGEGGKN